MTALDELKGHDCGNATKKTEKDTKVENSDNFDEDTIESNNMDKAVVVKEQARSCFNMMKAGKQLPMVQRNLMMPFDKTNGIFKSFRIIASSEVCAMYDGNKLPLLIWCVL